MPTSSGTLRRLRRKMLDGRPQIGKMRNGKWAAIVPNGYNADGDGATDTDGDGDARLFIIYLDGSGFIELSTGIGNNNANSCLSVASDCNGLSEPELADLDGDFVVDRIYAGDLHGNMWVFDVSSTNAADWDNAGNITQLFAACRGGLSFTGLCNIADRQPITTKPELIGHPTQRSFTTAPNVLVYFGTGQYIAEGDNVDFDDQAFYAVWDTGSATTLTRSNLEPQSFVNSAGTIGLSRTSSVTYGTGPGSDYGWYIDLNNTVEISSGARVIINPLILGELIFFSATVPDAGLICTPDNDNYLIALDALNGTESSFPIYDSDNDGEADTSSPVLDIGNSVGFGTTIGSDGDLDAVISNETGTFSRHIEVLTPIDAGRKSWSIIR
ncbi:MAG: PilC/PilY family type IV pilus protein [Pseudomonadota bacterium]